MELLDREIKNPSKGLPEEVFRLISSLTPMVNVDLLIRNRKGETLLTWRHDDLYAPGWHIPGGIVRYKESMASRICAVARKELSVKVQFDPMPLAMTEVVASKRRVRGHFISFLYACQLKSPLPDERRFCSGSPHAGEWAWHAKRPSGFMDCQKNMYGAFLRKGALSKA